MDYWLQTKGRPCPRVDLDPSLALEAEILMFGRHPDMQHYAGSFFEAIAESHRLPQLERLSMLRRVHAVLSHDEVVSRLHPAPQQREE